MPKTARSSQQRISNLKVAGGVRDLLIAVAAYHRRSQTNAVEWLIAVEYERLLADGKIAGAPVIDQARAPIA